MYPTHLFFSLKKSVLGIGQFRWDGRTLQSENAKKTRRVQVQVRVLRAQSHRRLLPRRLDCPRPQRHRGGAVVGGGCQTTMPRRAAHVRRVVFGPLTRLAAAARCISSTSSGGAGSEGGATSILVHIWSIHRSIITLVHSSIHSFIHSSIYPTHS